MSTSLQCLFEMCNKHKTNKQNRPNCFHINTLLSFKDSSHVQVHAFKSLSLHEDRVADLIFNSFRQHILTFCFVSNYPVLTQYREGK